MRVLILVGLLVSGCQHTCRIRCLDMDHFTVDTMCQQTSVFGQCKVIPYRGRSGGTCGDEWFIYDYETECWVEQL